jgi:hypothetical protein
MIKSIIAGILASNASLTVLDVANIEGFKLGTFDEVIWKDRLAVYWTSKEEWDTLRRCLADIYHVCLKADTCSRRMLMKTRADGCVYCLAR